MTQTTCKISSAVSKNCVYHSFKSLIIVSEAYYGYKKDDIVMLTDDSTNPRMMPTRENMVRCLYVCIICVFPNSIPLSSKQCNGLCVVLRPMMLYFSIVSQFMCELKYIYIFFVLALDSGHGGQTKDLDGDEADGFDEGYFNLFNRSILANTNDIYIVIYPVSSWLYDTDVSSYICLC